MPNPRVHDGRPINLYNTDNGKTGTITLDTTGAVKITGSGSNVVISDSHNLLFAGNATIGGTSGQILTLGNTSDTIAFGANISGNVNMEGGTLMAYGYQLKHPTGPYVADIFKAYGSDSSGLGAYMQTGGALIIGSGESSSAIYTNLGASSEELWLASDASIRLMANVQNGYATRKEALFDTSGNLTIPGTMGANAMTITTDIAFTDATGYWLKTSTNWGIYWDTSTNILHYHGGGTSRFSVDLDTGDTIATGNLLVSGATKLAGAFYTGTTNPTNTNRLNLDGYLYGTVLYSGAIQVATLSGTETLSGKTLTAPKFASGGYIADANGNELVVFTTTASAVNELTVINAATTGNPKILTSGGDTNINLAIEPKGTGNLVVGTTTTTTNLILNHAGESATLTNFTQALTSAGINIVTDYTAGSYMPGLFWSTSNSDPTKPKVGIWAWGDGTGSRLYFGTSNSYATGITNNTVYVNASGVLVNAGYNDIAETFKADDEVEPGDVVIKNPHGEGYVKSRGEYDALVVGVVSDSYGYLLGAEEDGVPVGLAGKLKVKVTGDVEVGDILVSSEIPGVAMASRGRLHIVGTAIGKALESHEGSDVSRIMMLVMNA